jgi:hypothetical protein
MHQIQRQIALEQKIERERIFVQTEKEYLKIVSIRFSKAFDLVAHAINQLDDQQIWYRPSNNSNSIGIILQHLSGNLHQWVCSAVGGETFQRHRALEFHEGERSSKKDILNLVEILKKKIETVISQVSTEDLLSSRRVQGFDETVMSVLLAALTHFELHTGQIILIAKLILGEPYQESWRPTNAEQGKD